MWAIVNGVQTGALPLFTQLPRMRGQGRSSELLYTGRAMTAEEGLNWGFFNSLHASDGVLQAAEKLARQLADGPTFAHGMTKKLLHQAWIMGEDEDIGAEPQRQAIGTQTTSTAPRGGKGGVHRGNIR